MHIADWLATFAAIVGVDPMDHKAAADPTHLPPIDSLNMWPMISGANISSPRDELVLSMSTQNSASTYGLILGHYKLVVCAKCEGFFPGVHIPNSTNDGRNITNSCDPGCLFDLDADPIEHVDLASKLPGVLTKMLARGKYWSETVYQSPGGSGADPAATAQAIKNGGFWGPWQPDGPLPTPAPLPPSPLPTPMPIPTTGFFLKYNGSCLRASSTEKAAAVHMGPCDGLSKWTEEVRTNATTGVNSSKLVLVAATSKAHYLRHQPPATTCGAGTPVVVGESHAELYTAFDRSTGTLRAVDCQGMCVSGLDASLRECTAASSAGWTSAASCTD
jgi:hypothetical protein